MDNTNRIYVPYWNWEEFKNGMYENTLNIGILNDVILFMEHTDLFFMYMKIVVKLWHHTMLHNLTNVSKNRIAFIGQCACCYALGSNYVTTVNAWKILDSYYKNLANLKARICLGDWINERKNIKIHTNLER